MRYIVVASLLLSIPFAVQAQAQTEPAIPFLSVGVRGGLGSYVMSDVNVVIQEMNDLLLAADFDELTRFGSGPLGGGELRLRLLPYLALSMTMDYLYQSSGVELMVVGEEFLEVELFGSTAPITARVLYVAQNSSNPKIVYTAGGGLSYLLLGRYRETYPGESSGSSLLVERTADGNALGFQATAGIEYFAKPWLSVGGELLYRYAKISELTYNDTAEPVLMSSGEKMSLDFSGFNFLACIRFHL
ncbi:MAG: outer membrane beta-barrel protein [Candidatus Eiseniibacteriota bacterium]|nr:MAG: outer membrane beta-barrel protein [Candidatus Eisenbacteria bacterium]